MGDGKEAYGDAAPSEKEEDVDQLDGREQGMTNYLWQRVSLNVSLNA